MSFAIIVGNAHGFRTGEWNEASRTSVRWIVTGIVILVLGVFVIAQGKTLLDNSNAAEQKASDKQEA
jgi:hypothetical protein